MKRSRTWMLLELIVILSIPLVFNCLNTTNTCLINRVSDNNCYINASETDFVTNITLILNYHDGENVTFYDITLIGKITPFNATIVAIGKENISYSDYTYMGVFVKGLCINGTWYKNGQGNRYWLYYVNEQFATMSCSVFELNNNSIVEWIFKGGNPFEEENKSIGEFWFYTGIFIGIVAACGVGVFFLTRKGV